MVSIPNHAQSLDHQPLLVPLIPMAVTNVPSGERSVAQSAVKPSGVNLSSRASQMLYRLLSCKSKKRRASRDMITPGDSKANDVPMYERARDAGIVFTLVTSAESARMKRIA